MQAYGVELNPVFDGMPEWLIELEMFKIAPALEAGRIKLPGFYTGGGRAAHFKRLVEILLPDEFDMNEWACDQTDLFGNYQWATITGPKSGGKTTTAALYGLFFWLCDPMNTAVIMTSTTVPGLRRRVWKEMKRFWSKLSWMSDTANMVESKLALQAKKGDDGNGIFGIAVAGGQTEKALGRIIGFHPKRLLIIVDEMTDTPEAIVDACANLSKTEIEFQFIGIGNAKDKLDPHGRMCEPAAGWNSITVDSDFWETKLGACLHLDGLKSPNVILRKVKYRYLLTQKDIDDDAGRYGENSPKFWRFVRGFWPPDDIEQKVCTQSMFDRVRAKVPAVWSYGFTPVGALDPSTGGDRCMLRFGRRGIADNGLDTVEFTEAIPVKLDASSEEPLHFQVARQAREACKQRGVQPQHFGIDVTGLGSGTADILAREWSPLIQRVNFNDRPTDRPVSETNPRPCNQEYYNFVTELWFSFRRFLESDQLRGLTDEDIFEFTARQYEMRGNLYQVEPKPEMKGRIGRSPDLADSDAILLEVCRRHGMTPQHSTDAPALYRGMVNHNEQARKMDPDSQPDNYTHGENITLGDDGYGVELETY